MISFNTRAKSVLLACALVVSTHNSFCGETQATNMLKSTSNYIVENKGAIAAISTVTVLAILYDLLKTQQRVHYSYDNWTQDIKDLLKAYNIFDAESRAVVKHFVKKYLVGAELKLDEFTVRTKEEDGSVTTIKRKKLTQRPSGFMGLLDAYVFQQADKITNVTPAMAALYVLIMTPGEAWKVGMQKALPKSETK